MVTLLTSNNRVAEHAIPTKYGRERSAVKVMIGDRFGCKIQPGPQPYIYIYIYIYRTEYVFQWTLIFLLGWQPSTCCARFPTPVIARQSSRASPTEVAGNHPPHVIEGRAALLRLTLHSGREVPCLPLGDVPG